MLALVAIVRPNQGWDRGWNQKPGVMSKQNKTGTNKAARGDVRAPPAREQFVRYAPARSERMTMKKKKPLSLTQKNIDRKLIFQPGRYSDKKGRVPGLRLVVTGNSASWIYRYWRDGRARDHGLGSARIRLKDARARAAKARDLLDQDTDPIEAKKAERQARRVAQATAAWTFKACAEGYFNTKSGDWSSRHGHEQFLSTMRTYVYPLIGSLPVKSITKTEVLRVLLQQVEADRGLPSGPLWTVRQVTAQRVRRRIEAVLAWATVFDYRVGDNPARWRGHLELMVPGRNKTKLEADGKTVTEVVRHHPALPYAEVPAFLTDLRGYEGVAARALEFLALTASRTNEVLGAKWPEVDLATSTWTIPATRMKARREHRVPLSAAALEILKQLPREVENPYVFIGARNAHLSSMALAVKFRRSGYVGTVHGLRSSFRDWAAERSAYPFDVIEQALAHVTGSATERAYLRSDLFEQRRKLMAAWAEFCGCKPVQTDATVIPIRGT